MTRALQAVGALLVAMALARGAQEPPAASVSFIPGEKVMEAFARGMPLLETERYKVHASRREGPGQVEVHAEDTDVIYVLTGTATLVTGGAVVDGSTVAPGEVRGASVRGGEARRVGPGDVIVVPYGVPHWFREVPGPITYYVVKVAR
ncbi:MAG TPA: cupin domain-containing protein [Vicinamibacteria bacterium]|nr:cupin domain-containing protein [Vicinamibacteria bacterium]